MGDAVTGSGGYFTGRAANKADEQLQAAAAETKPANTSTQAAGGTTPAPLNHSNAAQPAGEPKRSRSRSFTECSGGSSNNEETHNMENKRNRRSDNPIKLPWKQIELITNNFSEELGRSAFGQVFKGVLEDGEEVAVKMLRFMGNINDQQFENEFEILKRLEHPNIVRLVGFCDEAKEVCIEYNGNLIVCQRIHRALCLEYMPNGSLGNLLSGENLDKNWPLRYKIIKGVCEGLKYLQEGLQFPVFHLDLKPDNILLSQLMTPKISDFGSSRLIGEENTKKTLTHLGTTFGYCPPEFINDEEISKEYDIYSLGVIVKKIIVNGITDYSNVVDMGAQESIQHVHDKWKICLQERLRYAPLEQQYCKEVKRCIEIATRCMENDRYKRPIIKDIVSQLDKDEMENFKLDSQLPLEKVSLLRTRRIPKKKRCLSEIVEEDACPGLLDGVLFDYCPLDSLPSWLDPEPQAFDYSDYWELGLMLGQENVWEAPKQIGLEKEKRGNVHSDLLSEISHPSHPEHKLKLMTDAAGAPFLCDGCKEPGYGARYTCDLGSRGQSINLHARCALEDNLVLPLFGYGKRFEFRFLHEAPSSSSNAQEGRRVCDACGDATGGFVYHCSEQDIVLHPCCASLPDRFLHDGRAFDLHRRASRPCALCPENEGRHRWFWAYRCYVDGEAIDLHVACLKETARRSWDWEADDYRNRLDVGSDEAVDVDSMLENMFSSSIGLDKFGEIAGTAASFITALVWGNLILKL